MYLFLCAVRLWVKWKMSMKRTLRWEILPVWHLRSLRQHKTWKDWEENSTNMRFRFNTLCKSLQASERLSQHTCVLVCCSPGSQKQEAEETRYDTRHTLWTIMVRITPTGQFSFRKHDFLIMVCILIKLILNKRFTCFTDIWFFFLYTSYQHVSNKLRLARKYHRQPFYSLLVILHCNLISVFICVLENSKLQNVGRETLDFMLWF